MKRPKSPGGLKHQGSFRASTGVATISRSARSGGNKETSFSVVEPPTLLRDPGGESRGRPPSVATIDPQQTTVHDDPTVRAWSVTCQPSPPQVQLMGGGGNGSSMGGGGGGGGDVRLGGGDVRPNGWATFLGDVPEPPPPPRTSTLRREKKVTILEQAVQRL
ncbi:hypothetical protein Pmani_038013 [Petrolisthes manimaculis]|uniref:Uncharacterized protein n=1 Tax=Petrolisthes manimaculis TaxID=1843537 RepID=A0AAE1TMR6_9EUCA|nr:hypothetical protein Pmani_038013 [Petrolisthes manimaculis]